MVVHVDSEQTVHANNVGGDDRTLCGDALEEDCNGIPMTDARDQVITCKTCCAIIRYGKRFPTKMIGA